MSAKTLYKVDVWEMSVNFQEKRYIQHDIFEVKRNVLTSRFARYITNRIAMVGECMWACGGGTMLERRKIWCHECKYNLEQSWYERNQFEPF